MSGPSELNGLLLIDKPQGLTSHDAALRLRRLSGQKKIGHTGSLDPMATGLMAALFGAATRLTPYLSRMDKAYWGRLELGLATETDDLEGRVISRRQGPWPGEAEIRRALKAAEGESEQTPPSFSAVKTGGVRAYRAARQGRPLELAPRRVTAFKLTLLGYEPPSLEFQAEVSSGYYIRALARDLGRALDLGGGALSGLRRLRVGPWPLAEAFTLDQTAAWSRDQWLANLRPPAEALPHWPSWVLNDRRTVLDFVNGRPVSVGDLDARETGLEGAGAEGANADDASRYKVMDGRGRLLGLARIFAAPQGSFLRPLRVFPVL